MNPVVIRVEGISKQYRKGLETGKIFEFLQGNLARETFWALKDVSFEVKQGEVLGVIGANGAGKSTLLKILSGLTKPNTGFADIRGRVGSLLEVGTGFHPELSGRENIYLNGTLIGMDRAEIDQKFDAIVDFSGIEKFIDTPIKRYSSGMSIRLGFAIASHLEQEILLLDEVLAVGDIAFRQKCLQKIDEIAHRGSRTVVLVGHMPHLLALVCDRAIWLDEGILVEQGDASDVLHNYLEAMSGMMKLEDGYRSFADLPQKNTTEDLVLTHVRLLNKDGAQIPYVKTGDYCKITVGFQTARNKKIEDVSVTLRIGNTQEKTIAICQSTCVSEPFGNLPAEGEFTCAFKKLPLMPGRYRLGVSCQRGPASIYEVANAGEFTVSAGHFYPHSLPINRAADALFDYLWSVEAQSNGGGI